MTNQTFADALAQESGVSPESERAVMVGNCRISYEVSPTNLLLVAHQGSPVPLLLAPENEYTRQADAIGVSQESKIGSSEFDEHYVIRDTNGRAKELLTDDLRALIDGLAPFIELEFCDDMIRLLKKPQDTARAVQDLKQLAALAASLA